jgi:hypothetical protein
MNNPKLVLEFTEKSAFTKSTFKMVEMYDEKRLKAMIKSPFLKTVMPPDWDYFPFENEKKQLEDLLQNIKKNLFICEYNFRSVKIGRVYTTKTLGYISLRKELRAVFANDKFADIDIENAHPTMINQLCGETLGLTILPDYVNNRVKYFDLLMNNYNLSKDKSKQVIISILYGAGSDKIKSFLNTDELPAWIIKLKDEIKQVCKYIIQVNPKLKQLAGFKPDGSIRSDNGLLSYYIQEHERLVLECIYNFFITKGIFKDKQKNEGALCYDGIMILKSSFYNALLTELNEEIKNKTGFNLKFTCKDLVIDEDIKNYLDNFNYDVPEHLDEDTELGAWYLQHKKTFEETRFKCDDIFYEKNNNELKAYTLKSFETKYTDYAITTIDKKTYNFFSIWKMDTTKIKYDRLVFNLDLENTPKDYLNLFDGFQITKDNEDIPLDEIKTLIEPIIGNNGLLYHLSGKDINVLDYLLKYFAGILKATNPSDRPGVMIIFRDIAGILSSKSGGNGKDTFINWFSKQIIGQKYYFECSRTDDLFEKFNDYLHNKIIVNVPELEGIVKCSKHWNALKNYITSQSIKIEAKGIKADSFSNYMNIIGSTNEDFTLEPDRRLLVIDVSKDNKDNVEYWNNLYNNVLNNHRVARAFYLYLTKHIDTYNTPAEYQDNKPNTVAKIEQIENKKSLLQLFFEDIASKNILQNETKLDNTKLLASYKKWCDKHNFSCELTTNGLGQKLTRLSNELESNQLPIFISKYKSGSIRGWKLSYEELKTWYNSNNPVDDCLIDDTDE